MPEIPDPRAPKQARSAWTRERLLDVLGEMLAEQPLHEIGVAELATRADVTVGAIYGRFGGKHEMAVAGFERFADDAIARMESWASDPRRSAESPHEIALAWASGATAFGRRRSPMGKLATSVDDPAIVEAEQRIVACATRSLAVLLAPHTGLASEDLEHELAFAVVATHSVMARRLLVPTKGVHGFSDDELKSRLTGLILSSVGLRSSVEDTSQAERATQLDLP